MSSDDVDTRIPCKYGVSCYQKNVAHIAKYKHPQKRRRSESSESSDALKKQKNENEEGAESKYEKTDEIVKKQKTEGVSSSDDELVQELNLLQTFEDRKGFIKQRFLVDMPADFYLFWDLCKELNKEKPKEALKSIGLILVGPYDILDKSFQARNVSADQKYFLHWRYYYDPPEFQTVIKGDEKTGYHIGYFRDSPEEKPSFVGCNEANKNCTIISIGENLFGALNSYLEKLLKAAPDPFRKMSLARLQRIVGNKARDLKITMIGHGKSRKTVCKSFHNAGIVVPYNRSSQLGYRSLPVDDKELQKLLNRVVTAFAINEEKAFSSIQSIITAATIANDECDFGTALELGINMFCFGHPCFNATILNLLKTTYTLLNRLSFAQIIEAHLTHRNKGIPYVIKFN